MRSSWDACKALLLFFAISCVVAPSLGQSSRSLKISGEDVDAQVSVDKATVLKNYEQQLVWASIAKFTQPLCCALS